MPPCEVELLACGSCEHINTAEQHEMPPCGVDLLACGSCEHINTAEQHESPKRKRTGEVSKSKFGNAVPYKKRKVKKSVKFSPASVFRVVECVPGEWCAGSDEDSCEAAACGGMPGPASPGVVSVDAHHEDTAEQRGPVDDEPELDSAPASPSHVTALAAQMAASLRSPQVLHEKKISTKDGDGPSTIGLICNALIMGLVDRSITNAETAIDAMRQVIKAAASSHGASSSAAATAAATAATPGEDDCDDTGIGEHVFEEVLERLQQLVEHLDRHERVGLLPSTARLGKPFIPALKCLQGTLRLAMERLAAGGEDEEDDDEAEVAEDVEESREMTTPTTPESFKNKDSEPYLA
jgi:hypothetical protein